jgi:hypothetical protein
VNRWLRRNKLYFIVLLLSIPAIIGGISLLLKSRPKQEYHIARAPIAAPTPDTVPSLLTALGKLVPLPSGEIPKLVTITDMKKLQLQPFLAKAQDGDKLVMYIESKHAFLYRPATQQLIQQGELEIITASGSAEGSSSAVLSASSSATATASPVLRIRL